MFRSHLPLVDQYVLPSKRLVWLVKHEAQKRIGELAVKNCYWIGAYSKTHQCGDT